ncbi:MAG TPA: GAF domain-containing sensor histidine kinase [Chloroflexota bacterium]|nr:GAF domain-containing sensor histidine kinase [Chloroflexota bacterium]
MDAQEDQDRRSRPVSVGQSLPMRAGELGVLNAVAEALNGSVQVGEALTRTLSLVTNLLHLNAGWVWLLDPETRQFYNAAVHNLPPYLQEPVRMTGEPCHCMREFRRGRLNSQNIGMLECSRLRRGRQVGEEAATGGLRYHASIPLAVGGRPVGIMNLTGPSWRQLSPTELRLLSTIAYQVGIAVERARLAEESARLARAEERERIAREIHDTLAQGLTAIALQIEAALPDLLDEPEKARARLEQALAVTRDSLEEARRSVLYLRTTPLAGRPLTDALTALARRFTHDTGIRVAVDASSCGQLPVPVEGELFRIAQEALANVRSHADARQVLMTLHQRDRRIVLSIRDDGAGFDAAATGEGRHGIVGMRERARLLGGYLRIRTRGGMGTTVTASVPREDAAT